VLNHLIPDVFIYTDHYKGRDAGASPGFGCSLAAESTEGVVLRYAHSVVFVSAVWGQS
jgi:RNA 3'-terminal phosphate cyclase-like protein